MPDDSPISLRDYVERLLADAQHAHGSLHEAFMVDQDRLRAAWRADALQWRENHAASHQAHVEAHDKEHALNQTAISKAEASVDKAVGAARETMETNIGALAARFDHMEDEQRRRLDEINVAIHQTNLLVTSLSRSAETNAKSIQSLNESQTWVVRLVAGAILLALLALIFRPAVLNGLGG